LKGPEETRPDDWTKLPIPARPEGATYHGDQRTNDEDPTESERRLQPELIRVKPVEKKKPLENEFEIAPPDEVEEEAMQNRRMIRQVQGIARQVAMDPNDGMEL
jgi:type IV secretion system protein VirD4